MSAITYNVYHPFSKIEEYLVHAGPVVKWDAGPIRRTRACQPVVIKDLAFSATLEVNADDHRLLTLRHLHLEFRHIPIEKADKLFRLIFKHSEELKKRTIDADFLGYKKLEHIDWLLQTIFDDKQDVIKNLYSW